jgi:hypothetical protein
MTVHVPGVKMDPAGIKPPLRAIVCVPAAAVSEVNGGLLQVVLAFGGLAMVNPAGRLSVNATPV